MRRLALIAALISFGLVLLELALTRVFAVVLFASLAHLALAVALMGISVGAVAQHLWPGEPSEAALLARLRKLTWAQAALSVLVVVLALALPLTVQSTEPVDSYVADRLKFKWDLLVTGWFAVLLPVLVTPFATAGWAFAAIFQHRREQVGPIYAADLAGGALAGLLFIPLLTGIPAPELAFVAGGAALLAAAVASSGSARTGSLVAGVAALAVAAVAGVGFPVLNVRYPAGFTEQQVVYERWTPMARLALWENGPQTRVLLDNSSSSEVVLTRRRAAALSRSWGRGLVYVLHEPPGRIAVIAASAGPDVAVAQHHGFTGVEAIDVASDIGDLVAARYAKAEVNPWRDGGTVRVFADGRSAIAHSHARYDVIQMMYANLHGIGGMMANAWSPALLGTADAFEVYLDKLADDGTISFSRGSRTSYMAQSAAEALRRRGVSDPHRHIALAGPAEGVVLVKKRPFTQEERDLLVARLAGSPRERLIIDPTEPLTEEGRAILDGHAMTDNRPYTDSPSDIVEMLRDAAGRLFGSGGAEMVRPENVVYYMLLVEGLVVGLGGLLVMVLPLARMGEAAIPRRHWALLYVCGIGYGYLAVEIALIHGLSLFVGHPLHALTLVVTTLMLASGAGSLWTDRVTADRALPTLRLALAAVLGLGLVQALVLPTLLDRLALGWPLPLRMALTAATLAPLGFAMGMPWSLGLRQLRPEAGNLVPWMWAINGWTSVAAALCTVVIARIIGYDAALLVALVAYAGSLAVAGRLATVGAPAT